VDCCYAFDALSLLSGVGGVAERSRRGHGWGQLEVERVSLTILTPPRIGCHPRMNFSMNYADAGVFAR